MFEALSRIQNNSSVHVLKSHVRNKTYNVYLNLKTNAHVVHSKAITFSAKVDSLSIQNQFLNDMSLQLHHAKQRGNEFARSYNMAHIQSFAGIRVIEKMSPKERLRFLQQELDAMPEQAKPFDIKRFQAAVAQADKILNNGEKANEKVVGDVYNEFFALMARLIHQEDSAANEIYQRIKSRTDNVDLLTTLLQRINSAPKGKIDWSKDEEMKKLIDAARAIGVDIPSSDYKLNDDQRLALTNNIKLKKDSMEQMTQSERVDFQRHMQNSSIWHQTRSNILKMYERTASTISGNMRPH